MSTAACIVRYDMSYILSLDTFNKITKGILSIELI